MAFTGKQQRNGTDIGGGERVTPPGPMPDVGPLMSQAQSAAEGRMTQGHQVFLGAGFAADVNDWDAGLAIDEQPGEM